MQLLDILVCNLANKPYGILAGLQQSTFEAMNSIAHVHTVIQHGQHTCMQGSGVRDWCIWCVPAERAHQARNLIVISAPCCLNIV